mmetsp:Transcript_78853/g.223116  ORF Transcript_78853/g.223116 Transcript_78853/m.223116 type:complete len:419 (+) Transcript_78853:336-1592(+)
MPAGTPTSGTARSRARTGTERIPPSSTRSGAPMASTVPSRMARKSSSTTRPTSRRAPARTVQTALGAASALSGTTKMKRGRLPCWKARSTSTRRSPTNSCAPPCNPTSSRPSSSTSRSGPARGGADIAAKWQSPIRWTAACPTCRTCCKATSWASRTRRCGRRATSRRGRPRPLRGPPSAIVMKLQRPFWTQLLVGPAGPLPSQQRAARGEAAPSGGAAGGAGRSPRGRTRPSASRCHGLGYPTCAGTRAPTCLASVTSGWPCRPAGRHPGTSPTRHCTTLPPRAAIPWFRWVASTPCSLRTPCRGTPGGPPPLPAAASSRSPPTTATRTAPPPRGSWRAALTWRRSPCPRTCRRWRARRTRARSRRRWMTRPCPRTMDSFISRTPRRAPTATRPRPRDAPGQTRIDRRRRWRGLLGW